MCEGVYTSLQIWVYVPEELVRDPAMLLSAFLMDFLPRAGTRLAKQA